MQFLDKYEVLEAVYSKGKNEKQRLETLVDIVNNSHKQAIESLATKDDLEKGLLKLENRFGKDILKIENNLLWKLPAVLTLYVAGLTGLYKTIQYLDTYFKISG